MAIKGDTRSCKGDRSFLQQQFQFIEFPWPQQEGAEIPGKDLGLRVLGL